MSRRAPALGLAAYIVLALEGYTVAPHPLTSAASARPLPLLPHRARPFRPLPSRSAPPPPRRRRRRRARGVGPPRRRRRRRFARGSPAHPPFFAARAPPPLVSLARVVEGKGGATLAPAGPRTSAVSSLSAPGSEASTPTRQEPLSRGSGDVGDRLMHGLACQR